MWCTQAEVTYGPARNDPNRRACRLRCSRLLDRRWLPGAVEDRRWCLFRPIEPQHGDELAALRRRQPVGLVGGARVACLKVKIDRSVGVVLERFAGTGRQYLQRAALFSTRRVAWTHAELMKFLRPSVASRLNGRAVGTWPTPRQRSSRHHQPKERGSNTGPRCCGIGLRRNHQTSLRMAPDCGVTRRGPTGLVVTPEGRAL
jgi:hypothetical protein